MRRLQANDGRFTKRIAGTSKKMLKRGDRADVVIAESPEALIASQLADQLSEMGWIAEDFRIMPCCKDGG